MALIIKDRVKETTTTTGTGAVSLGGASAAFDSFQSVMSNGDTTFYAIVHTASNIDEWEVGLGTWNTGNTLTRTTVYAGSNGTSAVNFSSGDKDIFMTYPASKAVVAGEDVTFADITVTGTVDGVDIATNIPSTLGTAGQVLTVNSGGTAGEWADAAAGGGADLYAVETTGSTDPSAGGTLSIAIGSDANAFGSDSVAIGTETAAGNYSVAVGKSALSQATSTGLYNTAVGWNSSIFLTTGDDNSAFGRNALQGSSLDKLTGSGNTGIGSGAGASISSGDNNLFAGTNAGNAITTGDSNTVLGYNADGNASTSQQTAIGYNAQAAGTSATALTNSRASGADSFAAAIGNNTSSYGATGAHSIAMSDRAKATGIAAMSFGLLTQATGDYAFAVGRQSYAQATADIAAGRGNTASGGQSVALGSYSTSSALNSISIGHYAKSAEIGKIAFGSGGFNAAVGSAQSGTFILRSDTTDATAEALTTNQSTASTTNQIILPNNSAYAFHGTIVARESAADGTDCAAWKVEGLIRREGSAGTTVLVNSATTVLDNTPSWGMALSADTTNGGLAITVTGAASTNIRWVATIHTSEVTYA